MTSTLLGPVSTLERWTGDEALILDFINDGIDRRLSTVRGTDKWVYDETGILVRVPPNSPAIQHDPETGERLGLLREHGETNRIYPTDGGGDWHVNSVSEVINGVGLGADGTMTLRRLLAKETSTQIYCYPSTTYNPRTQAGIDYCADIYLKKNPGGPPNIARLYLHADGFGQAKQINFNVQTGEVTVPGNAPARYGWKHLPNGLTYIWVSDVATADSQSVFTMLVSAAGTWSAGDSLEFWGGTFKQGAFPGSFVPTSDAPATRAGDFITIPNDGWFNRDQGCVLIDYVPFGPRVGPGFTVSLNGIDGNNYIGLAYQLAKSPSGQFYWRNNGIGAVVSSGSGNYNTRNKYAFAWSGRNYSVCLNGLPVATGTSESDMPSIVNMALGSQLSVDLFQTTNIFRQISVLRTRPSNDVLRQLTSL